MKNKVQIIGVLLLLTCLGKAQTQFSSEGLKYWYYRDRLKYFVMPGTEPGQSVVITCRNSTKELGQHYPVYCGIETAQTHKLMGYYIGMLATEYKLLKDNGQVSDAYETLIELNLAMDALNRMDYCEMDVPWYKNDAKYNGFFIRDDYPPILSQSMTEYFNQDLASGSYDDYLNQIEGASQNDPGRPGLPFAIAETCVSVRKKYESSNNYYYQHPHYYEDDDLQYLFDIADYSLGKDGETYMKYWKQECFTSNDEIIGDLMGLALVSFLVDDIPTQTKANTIAHNYRNFMVSNPLLLMFFPNGSPISINYGGFTGGFAWGVSKLIHRMTNDFPISNYGLGPFATFSYMGSLGAILAANPYENFYNQGLYSKLVALAEAGVPATSPYKEIEFLGKNGNLHTFYLLLWAVANNKDLQKPKYEYPFDLLLNDLSTAPCGGPFCYHHFFGNGHHYVSTGWDTEYKYDSDLASQDTNKAGHNGVYPGLDYMLLYNLACLAFPDGFDYEGQSYSFPYYFNQINRTVTDKYAPLLVPGNPSLEISSTNNPEEIRAITSITSDMIVSNRAQLQLPMQSQSDTYIDGVFGDMTLKAGESIILTDGFRVDAGAHFLARIESYSCGGVSYKNMAAPPWSENYRGSYYDTLISVPMDQRAPIVYSEDNYEEEDFDMPLWEDYYMYDTTAATELAVGVWLNPNPCANKTTLTLVSESEQFLTIELFDMTGQKRATLFEGTADNNFTFDVDMSFYAKGMYLLRISGTGGSKAVRFVKE